MVQNTKRNVKIVEVFLSGASKAEIARRVGVSRERVAQIIKEITKTKRPAYIDGLQVDWKKLRKIRYKSGIPVGRIAKMTGNSAGTISRILGGNPRYINTPAAIKVIASMVKETNYMLDYCEQILDSITIKK